MEIRQILNDNTRGRQCWRSSASYLGEDAAFRSGLLPDAWDALPIGVKARRIAYLKARDVMDAWDSVPESDRKRWLLKRLASRP